MLKPIMGATAVLLIFTALFAGNLRDDITIQKAEDETVQAAPDDAASVEKAENKGKSDGVFSRRPPPPSKIGAPGDKQLDSFDNPQDDGFGGSQNPNDPFAPSPFVDPNSGFAGASNDPKPAAKADLTLPGAPNGDIGPAPVQDAPGI